jgi:hypothetical protein
MTQDQITFHNSTDMRVQAQVFMGRTLVSTCLANPGEIHTLSSGSAKHDIYVKDAATGWEVARKLDNEAAGVELRRREGHYILSKARSHID